MSDTDSDECGRTADVELARRDPAYRRAQFLHWALEIVRDGRGELRQMPKACFRPSSAL